MATKKKPTARKMEASEETPEEPEVEVDNEEGERYDGGPIPRVSPPEQSKD